MPMPKDNQQPSKTDSGRALDDKKNSVVTSGRYLVCKQEKEGKLALMEEIQKYLAPKDEHLVRDSDESRVLFDVRASQTYKEKATATISSIINPFSSWFSFVTSNHEVKDKVAEWNSQASEVLRKVISDAGYYGTIVDNVRYHKLYGFGVTAIFVKDKQIITEEQDPFSVVFRRDSNGDVRECYYEINYSLKELIDRFGYTPEDTSATKYRVLVAFTPNDPLYIDEPQESKRKWVQSFYFMQDVIDRGSTGIATGNNTTSYSYHGAFIEIGERKYFKRSHLVAVVEGMQNKTNYGEGDGRITLPQAQNLNQLKRDSLRISAYSGNPPLSVSEEVIDEYEEIHPGAVLPASRTGQEIQVLSPTVDPQRHAQLIILEGRDLVEQSSEGVAQSPTQQNNARKSQYEVQEGFGDQRRFNLISSVQYLQNAVLKHVTLIFDLCLDLGKIKLPEGVNREDISVSISGLIAREFQKERAQAVIQALGYAQPLFNVDPSVGDNLSPDKIFRLIFQSLGVGDVLEPLEIRDQVREQRLKEQDEQQAFERQLVEQQQLAQANKLNADADKSRAQAQGGF